MAFLGAPRHITIFFPKVLQLVLGDTVLDTILKNVITVLIDG